MEGLISCAILFFGIVAFVFMYCNFRLKPYKEHLQSITNNNYNSTSNSVTFNSKHPIKKCEGCGQNSFKNLGNDKYQCSYCGKEQIFV